MTGAETRAHYLSMHPELQTPDPGSDSADQEDTSLRAPDSSLRQEDTADQTPGLSEDTADAVVPQTVEPSRGHSRPVPNTGAGLSMASRVLDLAVLSARNTPSGSLLTAHVTAEPLSRTLSERFFEGPGTESWLALFGDGSSLTCVRGGSSASLRANSDFMGSVFDVWLSSEGWREAV